MRSTVLQLTEAVVQAAAAEPVEVWADEDVLEGLARLRADLDRLEIEFRRRVRVAEERSAHGKEGYPSMTALLKHRCRMTGGRASRIVAEATALAGMPVVSKLAGSGDLSLDQTQVLIRARQQHPEAFSSYEVMLADVARDTRFVSHLATAIEHWRQAVSDPSERDDSHERRGLHCSRTWQGMVRLDGWFDPEAGEILLDALDAATPPPAPGDLRSAAQRRADALVDLVSGRPAGRVAEIVVHVGDDRMRGKAETQGGTALGDERLSRVMCDCAVHSVVFGPDRRPIDVGRRHRLVTGRQRRALVARDRHCRFPGCDRPPRWTDAHHIVPWSRGGATDLANLVLLCRHHHTLVHDGGWVLSGPADRMTVIRPDGGRLEGDRSPP